MECLIGVVNLLKELLYCHKYLISVLHVSSKNYENKLFNFFFLQKNCENNTGNNNKDICFGSHHGS